MDEIALASELIALHAERLRRGWKPAGRKIGFTHRTFA